MTYKALVAMKKINITKAARRLRKHATINNGVLLLALLVAGSWAWGSVSVMQRNYGLQREVALKERQLQLTQLETARLEYEQRYYQTREYQELALRKSLGLALPGESALVLPANTERVEQFDTQSTQTTLASSVERSNWQQWMDFFVP